MCLFSDVYKNVTKQTAYSIAWNGTIFSSKFCNFIVSFIVDFLVYICIYQATCSHSALISRCVSTFLLIFLLVYVIFVQKYLIYTEEMKIHEKIEENENIKYKFSHLVSIVLFPNTELHTQCVV